MVNKNGFIVTNRDRVLRAWQNSTELVRDFQAYANEIYDDKQLSQLFAEYAEDNAYHASKLLEILQGYENKKDS